MKNSIGGTPKGLCKDVLHFTSFSNILLKLGSHKDGGKLTSSLPHEWLAEWKEEYIVETEQKNSIGATYLICEDACKPVLLFEGFCNILLIFGSHNDGCKLPSSLPLE